MIVVSDTSPNTNLAAIGQLELLKQLDGQIVIPIAVYNEMAAVDAPVPGAVEVQSLSWIQTQAIASPQCVTVLQNSHDDTVLKAANE